MRLGENVKDGKAIKSFKALPKKLEAKHQDRFDYSKAIFIDMRTHLEIICKEHGSFFQTPALHLASREGCPECALKYRKDDLHKVSFDSFLERLNNAQDNNYIVPKDIEYTTLLAKYTFICKIHNIEFTQSGRDALSGKCGCYLCRSERSSKRQRKSQEQWVEEATEFHKNKFDYSLVNYTGNKNKVEIICPKHGVFLQIAQQHLVYGCDKCARDAVNMERYKDTPTLFYTFEYKGLYKIGITTKKSTQLRYYKDITDWENVTNLIEVPLLNFPEAYMFEQFLINKYQEYRYWGKKIFNYTGITEVFTDNIYQLYLQETLDD